MPLISVHVRSPDVGSTCTVMPGVGATLVAWHPRNETAVFRLLNNRTAFSFSASFL
jgi:hypothetical protein